MAQASGKKGALRPRHVPQRTCVSCRRSDAKRGLIRLVRSAGGRVSVDETGRHNGRGAYLCHDPLCWANALKRKAIERALRLEQLDPDDRSALQAYAQALPPADAPTSPGASPADQLSD